MIKIGLIIPSLQSGGMERVMSELTDYFVLKKNTEVHLIIYGKNREIFFPISDEVTIHKPDFQFSDASRKVSSLKTLLFLRRTVKNLNPHVILSFGEYWNSFVLLGLYGLRYPIFISDRCQPNKSLGKLHDFLRKILYPKAAGIIAQTSKAKKVYEQQKLNKNIEVIGNPIYQIPTNGQISKENIVLTVGRLIESKHHDRLIKIFKGISAEGWKLVIVGGDALKQSGMQRLKKLINELNMGDSVELTGTVSDIESYYHKSKIFAFTSSSEGFPNVIGEAMSAGLPVISYDCVAGPSDMVEDQETGFLIPLYNDEIYSRKLRELIYNDDLRKNMGEKSKQMVKKYSVENIGERYYSFLMKDYENSSN